MGDGVLRFDARDGMGQGWWLEVGRVTVGTNLGDRIWASVASIWLRAKRAKGVGLVNVGGSRWVGPGWEQFRVRDEQA